VGGGIITKEAVRDGQLMMTDDDGWGTLSVLGGAD